MSVLHICCNLAGSTVFPQMFEALAGEGLEQIVFVPEKRKTFAQMPLEERSSISHRGKALREFKVMLEDYLKGNK